MVFIIAGIYGIINTLICGLILDPIKKKKGQAINSPIKKYSYIISSLMGLALINLFICFMRLNSGYRTGDIGSAFSYIIQSIIFAILLILMIIALIKAFKGRFDLATKKEKFKLFIIELLAVGQCMVIMIFDMYKFWAL